MYKFLIQLVDGLPHHDFSFHLIQSIKTQNWLYQDKLYEYYLSENVEGYPDCIPIGSLEFVFEYLEHYYGLDKSYIKPINIPPSLRKEEFTGRKIVILDKEDIKGDKKDYIFVKSNTQYKAYTDAVTRIDCIPNDEYMVSELIKMNSEWRAFVQNGKLLGIQFYSGDFTVLPNIEAVKNMIGSYDEAPLSYTLDIAMSNGKCVIVEIHPFVSCGLYGFNDYKYLPSMMIQGFNYMKKEAEKERDKSAIKTHS